MISANAPVMVACLRVHNATWELDVQQSIDVHDQACQYLKTHELPGTEYLDVAIWANMTSDSRATPTQSGDEHMSALKLESDGFFAKETCVWGRTVR
jgi:hypothetical protein